jgi:hypothetical protein
MSGRNHDSVPTIISGFSESTRFMELAFLARILCRFNDMIRKLCCGLSCFLFEITPPGYTVIARRDRQDRYGGVFIMAKSNTPCDELCTSQQSKLVAISVGRRNNQPLIITWWHELTVVHVREQP